VATITTATSARGSRITVQAVSPYGVLGEPASSADATAVSTLHNTATVVGRQFFAPDGRRLSRLQHGTTIVRQLLSDGTTRTVKVTAR
jgi:hypothetical protein